MPEITLPVGEQPDGTFAVPKLPAMAAADQLEAVRTAIDRIKTAEARLVVASRRRTFDGLSEAFRALEAEWLSFGRHQWSNVDALLAQLATAAEVAAE